MNIPTIDNMPYRKGANAIFINDEGRILLVQKTSYNDNEWDLPGGGLEEGEMPEDGITRELKEELDTSNFKIESKSQFINRFEWPQEVIERGFSKRNKWYRGQEKFIFVIRYFGSNDDLNLQAEEIRKSSWVLPQRLQEYLVFPGQYEAVKKVLDEFKIS